MRRWLSLIVLIFMVIPAYAWNVPDGFQDFKWGMIFHKVMSMTKLKPMDFESKIESWEVVNPKPIGDIPVRSLVLKFFDHKLVGVTLTFDSQRWPELKDAMTIRYGQPTDRMTKPYRESLQWEDKSLTITAIDHCIGSDLGCIGFSTDILLREEAKEESKKKKKRIEAF